MKFFQNTYTYFKQGFTISKFAWQRNLNYRFTVLTYRIGEILELLVLILMWAAIYAAGTNTETIKGFTEHEMITYILIGNLFSVTVRNFISGFMSRDILLGRLSVFLIRPISYIKYIFFHELGRSFLALILSILSQLLVISFFLDKVIFIYKPSVLAVVCGMVSLAMIIEMQIGFLVGTIAFWTDEVDGIESSYSRVRKFFSGGYFPLSILPTTLVHIGTFMPFAYSFFVPAQLYLGKITPHEGMFGILVEIAWILFLSILIRIVWNRGLKRYEAVGM